MALSRLEAAGMCLPSEAAVGGPPSGQSPLVRESAFRKGVGGGVGKAVGWVGVLSWHSAGRSH